MKSKLVFTVLLGLISMTMNSQVAKDYLEIYYTFSGNAADSSENDQDGTVHNAQLAMDRFGNSNSTAYFNGVDSYISMPTDSIFNRYFTISLWAMVEDYPDNGDAGVLLSYGNNGAIAVGIGNHYSTAQRTGWFSLSWDESGDGNGMDVGGLPDMGTWYHVVLVRDTTYS